ncbi:aspartate aminotransferase [Anaeramoeba ignava]|uniref:Aspartate aminotransferase n=1 Tax=Anaeramoeba ignava TaxID=1746090 RepID=A0A9Q0LXF9_ANAIG|nr:aspartate aminotransferase [Anaeramoeba ignava]
MKALYEACEDKNKADLSIGEYKDGEGKSMVLNVVREVETDISERDDLTKDYLPIAGDREFCHYAEKLVFGSKCKALNENRICSVQSIGGTGGVRLAAELIKKCAPKKIIYIPDPTWVNHKSIFTRCSLEIREYGYFKNGFDFLHLIKDLKAAEEGSFILLHACAHNPTGTDPMPDEWKQIFDILQEKNITPVFDSAYLGFATGNYQKDALAIREAVSRGIPCLVAQSFSKNLGLYSDRVGCLSVVCDSEKEAENVFSQLKAIIRPMYSNPPTHGSLIAGTIFANPFLIRKWKSEMKGMSKRIKDMRQLLYRELHRKKTKRSWDQVIQQIGMFSYLDLEKEHIEKLRNEYHIFMSPSGRASISGVNYGNINYIVKSIHTVLRR